MVTIRLEYIKCGKKNCHCVSGLGHGPYYYAYYKKNGKLHKKYLGLNNPYEGETITPQLLQELEREQYIEEILEEKNPFEEFQEKLHKNEIDFTEDYEEKPSKTEQIRKKNLEKSFEKLSD